MYLTDYRERCLKDVITQLEPGLFRKVTGLEVKDFELLVSLDVYNSSLMNDAVYKFKRYEDSSLSYEEIPQNTKLLEPENVSNMYFGVQLILFAYKFVVRYGAPNNIPISPDFDIIDETINLLVILADYMPKEDVADNVTEYLWTMLYSDRVRIPKYELARDYVIFIENQSTINKYLDAFKRKYELSCKKIVCALNINIYEYERLCAILENIGFSEFVSIIMQASASSASSSNLWHDIIDGIIKARGYDNIKSSFIEENYKKFMELGLDYINSLNSEELAVMEKK